MKKIYSPLRYPGGKSRILNFMKDLIDKNSFKKNFTYIEPYAGGAGVALGLLLDGYVSKIFINDIDPAVNSFWNAIIKNHDKFIKKIEKTEITIDEWKKQKEIYKNGIEGFNLGFSAFFLNRCNRSGILTAGCIGGLQQKGKYKIDCRFNKKDLINRIIEISKFKNKIKIYKKDTLELLQKKEITQKLKNCLLYLDPPYYDKGYQLYRNHYKHEDHQNLANLIKKIEGYWVISYDNTIQIKEMYKEFKNRTFGLTYFAGNIKEGKEIIFFSKSIKKIPPISLI
ncbi:MAG: DNA adenine methylase [Alphaproteobacteria bacterium]|nr:DNA adenine methylase [Alphaproteobacteria bacterium]MBL0718014.1 DNA adenine methylase [Alphaproteobacteria bacterium]